MRFARPGLIVVYSVNDLITLADHDERLEKLKTHLRKNFKIKDSRIAKQFSVNRF